MWLSLFLSTLETTIVSTSLVSITNALDGFLYRDWVVTAYLLTYTGNYASTLSREQRVETEVELSEYVTRVPHNIRKVQRHLRPENDALVRTSHLHALLGPLRRGKQYCTTVRVKNIR